MSRRLVVALVLACIVVIPSVSASAAAPVPVSARTVATRAEALTTDSQREVEAFWTPERMRVAERQTSLPDSWGAPWPGRTSRAVGRLFYSLAGRPNQLGVCSGAAVEGANASVVVTAAHCLYMGRDGGAHTNLYFVPAYDHQLASFQAAGWTARASVVLAQWQQGDQIQNLRYDYGFLTLNEKNGRRIAEVTGAHRLQFDAPVPDEVLAVGYPSALPYDGESLQYCGGVPTTAAQALITSGPGTQNNLVLTPCLLTRGASGGPWITGYDPASDLGTVVAVISVGAVNAVIGRLLDGAARAAYEAAQHA